MRRHATRLLEDVAKPLANLERDVAGIAVGRHSRDASVQVLWAAHKVAAQLENLIAVGRLQDDEQRHGEK